MLLDLDAIFDPDRGPCGPARSLPEVKECHPKVVRAVRLRTPDDLPPDWYILWDERAAIMEFEGGQTRERAEHYAWLDVTAQIRHAEACVGGRELGD